MGAEAMFIVHASIPSNNSPSSHQDCEGLVPLSLGDGYNNDFPDRTH